MWGCKRKREGEEDCKKKVQFITFIEKKKITNPRGGSAPLIGCQLNNWGGT